MLPPYCAKLFYVPLSFQSFSTSFLVDSGAFSSAVSPLIIDKIKQVSPTSFENLPSNPFPVVKVANGSYAKTLGLVNISFTLANQPFTEQFMILPKMNKQNSRFTLF